MARWLCKQCATFSVKTVRIRTIWWATYCVGHQAGTRRHNIAEPPPFCCRPTSGPSATQAAPHVPSRQCRFPLCPSNKQCMNLFLAHGRTYIDDYSSLHHPTPLTSFPKLSVARNTMMMMMIMDTSTRLYALPTLQQHAVNAHPHRPSLLARDHQRGPARSD
jgi:hypothetical protein